MESIASNYLLHNFPASFIYLSKVQAGMIPNLTGEDVIFGLYKDNAAPFLPEGCEWKNNNNGTQYVHVKVINHNIELDSILLETGTSVSFNQVNQNPISYQPKKQEPVPNVVTID